jgi:hypothetical protein
MNTPSNKNDFWDADEEEKKWRESLNIGRKGIDDLEAKANSSDFYVLCLAEFDAVVGFTRPENFINREVFIKELRNLIAEPTIPSRTVLNIQAYRDAQKWYLEWLIKTYGASEKLA